LQLKQVVGHEEGTPEQRDDQRGSDDHVPKSAPRPARPPECEKTWRTEDEGHERRELQRATEEIKQRAPPNGSAFSGLALPSTAPAEASDSAILPRAISAQRCHVRYNGLLDSAWVGRRGTQHREMMAATKHALPHCETLAGFVSALCWAELGSKASQKFSIVMRPAQVGRDLSWLGEPRIGI
jgi:hypothetical protein